MGGCKWFAGAGVWVLGSVLVGSATADSRVIDSPTAQVLGHGQMRWEVGVGPEGSVLTGTQVGMFERLHFGISYGMQDVLGRGNVDLNPEPGINMQLLVVDQIGMPAIAVGYNSQGRGRWVDQEQRYERKSHGFYAVATQTLLGSRWNVLTSITGGINYSMERSRESFDLFVGASQSFGRNLSFLLDYDLGLDERSDIDSNRGYLDFGFQWSFGDSNNVRFLLRDLLGNWRGQGKVARELNFYYLFRL